MRRNRSVFSRRRHINPQPEPQPEPQPQPQPEQPRHSRPHSQTPTRQRPPAPETRGDGRGQHVGPVLLASRPPLRTVGPSRMPYVNKRAESPEADVRALGAPHPGQERRPRAPKQRRQKPAPTTHRPKSARRQPGSRAPESAMAQAQACRGRVIATRKQEDLLHEEEAVARAERLRTSEAVAAVARRRAAQRAEIHAASEEAARAVALEAKELRERAAAAASTAQAATDDRRRREEYGDAWSIRQATIDEARATLEYQAALDELNQHSSSADAGKPHQRKRPSTATGTSSSGSHSKVDVVKDVLGSAEFQHTFAAQISAAVAAAMEARTHNEATEAAATAASRLAAHRAAQRSFADKERAAASRGEQSRARGIRAQASVSPPPQYHRGVVGDRQRAWELHVSGSKQHQQQRDFESSTSPTRRNQAAVQSGNSQRPAEHDQHGQSTAKNSRRARSPALSPYDLSHSSYQQYPVGFPCGGARAARRARETNNLAPAEPPSFTPDLSQSFATRLGQRSFVLDE